MKGNKKNYVILVNERDEWVGIEEKLTAHKEGLLHRAFSVFVLNDNDEVLIQKRADGKYHSAGLWSNTCCSHPQPGESTQAAAHRRLQEEMSFDCDVEEIFTYRYNTDTGNGLVENEYDHIYIGYYNGNVVPNKDEVSDYKFVDLASLSEQVKNNPEAFTTWFKLILPEFSKYLSQPRKVA